MSYTPTEWSNGDVITAEKLNKLENGVGDSNIFIVNISVYGSGGSYTVTADKTYTELKAAYDAGKIIVGNIDDDQGGAPSDYHLRYQALGSTSGINYGFDFIYIDYASSKFKFCIASIANDEYDMSNQYSMQYISLS